MIAAVTFLKVAIGVVFITVIFACVVLSFFDPKNFDDNDDL